MRLSEEDDRQLTAGLRDLAAAMESRQAPPSVERALLGRFRRRAMRRAAIRWGSVAAAVALLLVGFLSRRNPQAPLAHAVLSPEPAAVVSPPAAARPEAPIKPVTRRAPARKAPPPTPDREEQFFPLLYSDAAESVQVVRVKLPRAALASFGVPLAEEPGQDKIQADVALGEDGIARAVRFVRTTH